MLALIDRERVTDAEEAETVLLGAKEHVQSATDESSERLPA
jgi:hypothetical protein